MLTHIRLTPPRVESTLVCFNVLYKSTSLFKAVGFHKCLKYIPSQSRGWVFTNVSLNLCTDSLHRGADEGVLRPDGDYGGNLGGAVCRLNTSG